MVHYAGEVNVSHILIHVASQLSCPNMRITHTHTHNGHIYKYDAQVQISKHTHTHTSEHTYTRTQMIEFQVFLFFYHSFGHDTAFMF